MPTIFDAAEPNLRAGLAARPTYIKPNEDELGQLTGQTIDSLESAYEAGNLILERYGTAPIITLGPQGALAVLPGRAYRIPALRVEVVSAGGAGDAVLAGITASVHRGQPRGGPAPGIRRCCRDLPAARHGGCPARGCRAPAAAGRADPVSRLISAAIMGAFGFWGTPAHEMGRAREVPSPRAVSPAMPPVSLRRGHPLSRGISFPGEEATNRPPFPNTPAIIIVIANTEQKCYTGENTGDCVGAALVFSITLRYETSRQFSKG
ncbi:MAG: hypothetical protein IH587_02960 [Anaerolineae bacterium]|nr:hypothetical protein [Anaerolineae bacterium]